MTNSQRKRKNTNSWQSRGGDSGAYALLSFTVNFECGNIDISKPYQYAKEKSQVIGKANIINSFSADSQNPSYKVVIWKVNASLFIGQDFAFEIQV